MEKMDKKFNNKGFSLIELIVVISIMVVLVGLLGTRIVGHIDRTRYGKDMSALDSLKTAVQTYMVDGESEVPGNDEVVSLKTLIVGNGTVTYDPNHIITELLSESFEIEKSGDVVSACTFKAESKMFEDVDWEDILVKITDGTVSIVAPVNDGYDEKYIPYIAGKHQWTASQKVKN